MYTYVYYYELNSYVKFLCLWTDWSRYKGVALQYCTPIFILGD